MRIADLRSDTITRPTAAMRQAMATADVGDDVFGEDPTVKRLETMAAERLGKPAALFVASGTMANLVSQLAHCGRGDEMILGDQSHVFFYEQGGSAAVGGIHPRILPNEPDGTIAPEEIDAAIRPDDIHFPVSRLVVLANTHNRCYGTPLNTAYMQQVGRLVRRHGLKLHVDGARLFNAAAALKCPAKDLVADADSVAFCLSKGLGAPAGSMVLGDEEFVARARRARKILGGGMRQAGILAAAGIIALTEMTERLDEDHANARHLAAGLAEIPGLTVDMKRVHTNIVYIDIHRDELSAADLAARLNDVGTRVLPLGPNRLRAVTHHQVSAEDIEFALDGFRKVMDR